MEVGIGPVCRKLDNAILARQIPSDLPKALAAYKSVDVGTLPPETVPVFINIEADLIAPDAETRLDWRETVKRIEWLRSFSIIPKVAMQAFLNIVESLGYIGLASLWNGEAATGKSFVWFTAGRIFVSGPQNKAARLAFKAIYGWKFHGGGYTPMVAKPDGEMVKAWSFPVAAHEQVQKAVWSHYPNNEGLDTAINLAKGYLFEQAALAAEAAEAAAKLVPAAPAPAAPVSKSTALASLAENGWVRLRTPYRPAFIAAIKTLPYTARKWVPDEKVWEVAPEFKAKAIELLKAAFPDAIVEASVN